MSSPPGSKNHPPSEDKLRQIASEMGYDLQPKTSEPTTPPDDNLIEFVTGDENAPETGEETSEYQCGYCLTQLDGPVRRCPYCGAGLAWA